MECKKKINKKILFTEHELFCLSLFFHFQLYKIRPKRTRPQALLFLCMILLLIVLHTSYMIYSLASQYVMYGSQKYLVQVSSRRPGGGGSTSASASAFRLLPPFFFLPLSISISPCSGYCKGLRLLVSPLRDPMPLCSFAHAVCGCAHRAEASWKQPPACALPQKHLINNIIKMSLGAIATELASF